MTDRTFDIFMYFNLQKQSFEWMTALENAPNKYMANCLREAKKANERLIGAMEKRLESFGQEYNDKFWEDSEYFSKVLEIIKNAESTEKKQELVLLMMEYVKGN